jgi:MoaA/NifB/PqqE/SkfB family radical SAM enzyme
MKTPLPEMCFRYTIQKLNAHELPQFVELYASLGSPRDMGDGSRIDFGGLLDFKETAPLCVDEMPRETIDATVRKAEECKVDILFQHIGTKSRQYPNPSINLCLCWMEPYIMMGGYVLPCCSVLMSNQRTFLREHSLGNIYKTPMKEIWSSERYRRFRATVNDPRGQVPLLCKGCRGFDTTRREAQFGIVEDL